MELNDFIKKLNTFKEGIALKDERKKAMRARILYLMNLQEQPKVRPAAFLFPILRPVPIIAAFLILIMTGGTISFAAENSLPGDILYPIKINVNENLIAAVQFGTAAKASWEVDKTERRLDEASTLVVKGTNQKAQAEVQDDFEKTAIEAQEKIKSLNEAGNATRAAELAAQMEAVLKAHEQILAAVHADSTSTLEDKVSENLAQVEEIKAVVQAKIAILSNDKAVGPDAEVRIQKAKERIKTVKKFVENNSKKLSIEDTKSADNKLAQASQKVGDAETKLKDSPGEAFNSANDAGEEAHKVQILLKARLSLGIPASDDSGQVVSATLAPNTSSTPATSTPESTSTSSPN